MAERNWTVAIDTLKKHVVRVRTPDYSGSGFLVCRSPTSSLCAVATAWHVLQHAYEWEEPVRLDHKYSGESLLLHPGKVGQPGIMHISYEQNDTAAIIFDKGDFPLPESTIPLIPEGRTAEVGTEIGWMGFPAWPDEVCFFSGRISSYVEGEGYLVDGVAINGVSGGPSFFFLAGVPTLLGVVSDYIPNRATGEVLPGLSLVRDIVPLHNVARSLSKEKG